MRWLLRIVSSFMLALSAVLIMFDFSRALIGGDLTFTSLQDRLVLFFPIQFEHFEAMLTSLFGGLMLEPLQTTLLTWPAWIVALGVAFIFAILGYEKRPDEYLKIERV